MDSDLLIPIELSQATTGKCVQDLRDIEAGEAIDTSKAQSPPSQPCGQFQVQRSDNSDLDSIAHCRTNAPSQSEIFTSRTVTPSQREIFSHNNNNNHLDEHFRTNTSSQSEIFSEHSNRNSTKTGTETDIHKELHTPSQSESEATSSTSSTDASRTTTWSQSEMSTETSTEYDVINEANSRETSRSSPQSGNLTARSMYLPFKEMAILHKNMHDAIHAVTEQQGRAVTRNFFQQQQKR